MVLRNNKQVALSEIVTTFFLLFLCLSWLLPSPVLSAKIKKGVRKKPCPECYSVDQCLECHDEVDKATFATSVHGQNACTSCHRDIYDLESHADGDIPMGKVNCSSCHIREFKDHNASVHFDNEVGCTDCHTNIHELKSYKKDKKKSVAMCSGCHEQEGEDYLKSSHGKAVMAGNLDAPACTDCHGLHDIRELHVGDIHSKIAIAAKEFHTRACLACHANEAMMKRNHVNILAVDTYEKSYHGKVEQLGYPTYVAGCADCHTPHKQLPPSDPESSISKKGLQKTCGQCHKGANANFVLFMPHAEHTDKAHYPILYWTYMIMTGLLIAVFSFFWLHTLLWLIRSYIERNELREQGIYHYASKNPKVIYRRFSWLEKLLHLAMMFSFLGLVLTGSPLKFSDAPWAKAVINFLGGAMAAGHLHRWCAIITFSYFGVTFLWIFYFLFLKPTGENVFQKLFGPDSLFPRWKDAQDITAMFKWFFMRGKKPKFDRWTYWEKFDFLAVFWGMFAIGLSGMMLWKPQFFSMFLPGWAFNIATIVHSDEALLAAGFIFTVHFFNTHLRPEKFPMDPVIFTGVVPGYLLEDERPEQYARLKAKDKLKNLETKYPAVWEEAIGHLLGMTGLSIGILCIFLIGWGVFFG